MVVARQVGDIMRGMAELPAGTITLLFTDVEGSTRRWDLLLPLEVA